MKAVTRSGPARRKRGNAPLLRVQQTLSRDAERNGRVGSGKHRGTEGESRGPFSAAGDKHILLFVGQQIWYKNQKLILDTLRLLCDQGDDYFLVMVGTGKDEQEIERYAAS